MWAVPIKELRIGEERRWIKSIRIAQLVQTKVCTFPLSLPNRSSQEHLSKTDTALRLQRSMQSSSYTLSPVLLHRSPDPHCLIPVWARANNQFTGLLLGYYMELVGTCWLRCYMSSIRHRSVEAVHSLLRLLESADGILTNRTGPLETFGVQNYTWIINVSIVIM